MNVRFEPVAFGHSRDSIRTRLAAGRSQPAPLRGDEAAIARQDGSGARRPGRAFTPAAVLVPLIEHAGGFSVLFTQRTPQLKAHGGQISFPGGRLEPHDVSAVAGALRETQEEIGLLPGAVDVLGALDPYFTVTGYQVTPVVGALSPPLALKADPTEVAEVFEVPLAFFLDPANHQRHSRVADGVARAYDAMPYGNRYIWGATAGTLLNLYEVLTASA